MPQITSMKLGSRVLFKSIPSIFGKTLVISVPEVKTADASEVYFVLEGPVVETLAEYIVKSLNLVSKEELGGIERSGHSTLPNTNFKMALHKFHVNNQNLTPSGGSIDIPSHFDGWTICLLAAHQPPHFPPIHCQKSDVTGHCEFTVLVENKCSMQFTRPKSSKLLLHRPDDSNPDKPPIFVAYNVQPCESLRLGGYTMPQGRYTLSRKTDFHRSLQIAMEKGLHDPKLQDLWED